MEMGKRGTLMGNLVDYSIDIYTARNLSIYIKE